MVSLSRMAAQITVIFLISPASAATKVHHVVNSTSAVDVPLENFPPNTLRGSLVEYKADLLGDGTAQIFVAYQARPVKRKSAGRLPDQYGRADQYLKAFQTGKSGLIPIGTVSLGFSSSASFRTVSAPVRGILLVSTPNYPSLTDTPLFAFSISTNIYQVQLIDGPKREAFDLANIGLAGYATSYRLIDGGKTLLLMRYDDSAYIYRLFRWDGHDYRIVIKHSYPREFGGADRNEQLDDFLNRAGIPKSELPPDTDR